MKDEEWQILCNDQEFFNFLHTFTVDLNQEFVISFDFSIEFNNSDSIKIFLCMMAIQLDVILTICSNYLAGNYFRSRFFSLTSNFIQRKKHFDLPFIFN